MDVLTQYEVYVLYSSIDTNPRHAIVRKQEATAACAVWGINREHIIFLDYPDTANKVGTHFYTDGDKRIEESMQTISSWTTQSTMRLRQVSTM